MATKLMAFLKQKRTKVGLTRKAAAKKLKISEKYLGGLESAGRVPHYISKTLAERLKEVYKIRSPRFPRLLGAHKGANLRYLSGLPSRKGKSALWAK